MTGAVLSHLAPDQLDKSDYFWLEKYREGQYDAPSAQVFGLALARGQLEVIRVTGPRAEGVVLYTINECQNGRELLVMGMCGRSLVFHIPEILDELKSQAYMRGCRWIYTVTEVPQLSKKMHLAGLKAVGSVHRLELGA